MRNDFKYKLGNKVETNVEIIKDAYDHAETFSDHASRNAYLKTIEEEFSTQHQDMRQKNKLLLVLTFLCAFIILTFFAITIFYPYAIQQNFGLYKFILAVACAGFGALIPGYLKISSKLIPGVRATGAIGLVALAIVFVKPVESTFNIRIALQPENSSHIEKGSKVLLYLGVEIRESVIGDKNDALFENIPMQYLNQLAKIGVALNDKCKLQYPDSLYHLTNTSVIFLKMLMPLNNMVTGMVTYRKRPLEKVEVSIDSLKVITDIKGLFKIVLPTEGLKQEQLIMFYKPQFKILRRTISLQNLEFLEILMEK